MNALTHFYTGLVLPFTGGVILPTLKLDLILLTVHTISLGIATTLTFVSLKYLGKTVTYSYEECHSEN